MRTLEEIRNDLIDLSISDERYRELKEELAQFAREAIDPTILKAVQEHALAHYAEGWDPVVEAYEPWELADAIKGCTSVQDAIDRLAVTLDLRAEVRHDVRGYGDIVEPEPKPVPRVIDSGDDFDYDSRWEEGR